MKVIAWLATSYAGQTEARNKSARLVFFPWPGISQQFFDNTELLQRGGKGLNQ